MSNWDDDTSHEHPCPVKGCRNTTDCDKFHWMTQDEVDNREGPEPIPCDDHADHVRCDNCGEWAVCTLVDEDWAYCQPCRTRELR